MPEPTCIDLKARFGKRYRIRREAEGAMWYQTPEADRAWLYELRCKRGIVYPHGGDVLAATGVGKYVGKRLRALPGILSARGDVETVITFHVDMIADVLALLRPYQRRQMSETERARLKIQLQCARERRTALSGERKSELESTNGTSGDGDADD